MSLYTKEIKNSLKLQISCHLTPILGVPGSAPDSKAWALYESPVSSSGPS